MVRVTRASPKPQLVEDAFGYVSLFPVLLKLLPHDSDKLRIILENVKSGVSLILVTYEIYSEFDFLPYFLIFEWNFVTSV